MGVHRLTDEQIYYGTILTVHKDPKTMTADRIEHGTLYFDTLREDDGF